MKAQMNLLDEIIVDNFAGGGGASTTAGQEPIESFTVAQGAVDTYELQALHGLAWANSLELEYVLTVRVKGE